MSSRTVLASWDREHEVRSRGDDKNSYKRAEINEYKGFGVNDLTFNIPFNVVKFHSAGKISGKSKMGQSHVFLTDF